jgi:hypothetical protein
MPAASTSPLPEVVMPPQSRYAGQPADASSRRSVRLVERGEHAWTVDFFHHAGEFWRAVVPIDGVATIFGQTFNFSPPKQRKGPSGPETLYDSEGIPQRKIRWLNHLQTRFEFAPSSPIRLYPQGEDPQGPPQAEVLSMIYSVEVVGPAGVLFNLRDAVFGNFLGAHRFLSTEEMVFERIVVEGQYIFESAPLPLSADERRRALELSLERSDRAGAGERYFMYRPFKRTNNCTSNPFRLIDQVKRYRWHHWWGSFLYRLPLRPRLYLWVRGLDADPSHRKLLREEFAEFIADPATQSRKREYVRRQIASRRAAKERGPSA